MGKVLSVVSRKARRFNAENRAHRYLDKEKLAPAPKYQSNISDYERVLEENPNFAQQESKKRVDLDDRLKQVYVTSTDTVVPNVAQAQDASEPTKPLPLNRKPVQEYEFGYLEPEKVSRGRATLRQALVFISSHQNDPNTWTIEKISDDYKLKPSIVDSILKHFHTFDVYIPDTKSADKILLKDRVKQLFDDPKPLPPPTFEDDKVFNRLLEQHEDNERKKSEEKEINRQKKQDEEMKKIKNE